MKKAKAHTDSAKTVRSLQLHDADLSPNDGSDSNDGGNLNAYDNSNEDNK